MKQHNLFTATALVLMLAAILIISSIAYKMGRTDSSKRTEQMFPNVINFHSQTSPARVGDVLLMKDGSVMIFTEDGWKDTQEIPAR